MTLERLRGPAVTSAHLLGVLDMFPGTRHLSLRRTPVPHRRDLPRCGAGRTRTFDRRIMSPWTRRDRRGCAWRCPIRIAARTARQSTSD